MPGHVDRRQRGRGGFRQARCAGYFAKVPYFVAVLDGIATLKAIKHLLAQQAVRVRQDAGFPLRSVIGRIFMVDGVPHIIYQLPFYHRFTESATAILLRDLLAIAPFNRAVFPQEEYNEMRAIEASYR